MRATGTGAVIGVLAALVGTAAGHAVARLINPAASPVVAVGSAVIDLVPPPVKEWAVATFGTADKAVLVSGVILVVAGLGALAGALIGRRRPVALSLVVTLGVMSAAAALTRPDAGILDVAPAVAAVAVGWWVLAVVLGWVLAEEPDVEIPAVSTAFPDGTDLTDAAPPALSLPAPSQVPAKNTADAADLTRMAHPRARRRLLIGGLGLAGAGGFLALLGERTFPGLGPSIPYEPLVLPPPADPLGPLPSGLEGVTPALSPFRTPTPDFYRIDVALTIPRIDPGDWTLSIEGLVDHPYTIAWADLIAMPMIERDITP